MTVAQSVPVSNRLRAAAILAMAVFKKPIAAHEVENWVQERDL
jgi:hypothetical protein